MSLPGSSSSVDDLHNPRPRQSLVSTGAVLGVDMALAGDRYLHYVFTCLRANRRGITEDETIALFGPGARPCVHVDPHWMPEFKARCANRSAVAVVDTVGDLRQPIVFGEPASQTDTWLEGLRDTHDSCRRLISIESHGQSVTRRAPSPRASRHAAGVTFEREVFGTDHCVSLAVRISSNALSPNTAEFDVAWGGHRPLWIVDATVTHSARVTAVSRDGRSVTAHDGLALFRMVRSWRCDVRLTFADVASMEAARTLCALALGDPELGCRWRLLCVVPTEAEMFDLRALAPLANDDTETGEVDADHANNRDSDSSNVAVTRPSTVLRHLHMLPVAFSMLADTPGVCVLRHMIKDALLVVPKVRLTNNPVPPRPPARLYGHLVEWVPGPAVFLVTHNGDPVMQISSMPIDGDRYRPGVLVVERRGVAIAQHAQHAQHNACLQSDRVPLYDFEQAACLSLATFSLSVPNRLGFGGCVAVLCASKLARVLCPAVDSLVMGSSLNDMEAMTMMLATASVEDRHDRRRPPGAQPPLVASFVTTSRSVLLRMRDVLAVDSRQVPACPVPCLSPVDHELPEELEVDALGEDRLPQSTQRGPRESQVIKRALASRDVAIHTGHTVSISASEQSCVVRVTTAQVLGSVNMKILRAAGVLRHRVVDSTIYLSVPNTLGVLPQSWRSAAPTHIADSFFDMDATDAAPEDGESCFFQLNYAPKDRTDVVLSPSAGAGVEVAVVDAAACGFVDARFHGLYNCERGRLPAVRDVTTVVATIGDGVLFPAVDVVSDNKQAESVPLPLYKLHLIVTVEPRSFALARADRSTSAAGHAYEAKIDEAVLIGHAVGLLEADNGGRRDFDVSTCLSAFYRAAHPCVPDMSAGRVMLDYEFAGRSASVSSFPYTRHVGEVVWATLAHLADTCRVNSFTHLKLVTLTRARGASASSASTSSLSFSSTQRAAGRADGRAPGSPAMWGIRLNALGAFLCSVDHRLSPLLARCCDNDPLAEHEFGAGAPKNLTPRGDEDALLLEAYELTLGPVFEFERLTAPVVSTSLGLWGFLRLVSRQARCRIPGVSVVDGYMMAYAAESPLFYVRGEGPVVQRLSLPAVLVQTSATLRSVAMGNDGDYMWPEPGPVVVLEPRAEVTVLDEFFMRPGARDPLDGFVTGDRSDWLTAVQTRWIFARVGHAIACSWDQALPLNRSDCLGDGLVEWRAERPPAGLLLAKEHSLASFPGLSVDTTRARANDPAEWKGFDLLASRVLVVKPDETTWSRGTTMVRSIAPDTPSGRVPNHRITVVAPGLWCATTVKQHSSALAPLSTLSAVAERADTLHVTEVHSAQALASALAEAMLSDEIYAEVEVACAATAAYGYVQRLLSWFAGITGPFRSRSVTVTCSVRKPWTSGSTTAVDIVSSQTPGYLVSLGTDVDDWLVESTRSSTGVMIVRGIGNVVLHATRRGAQAAMFSRNSGLHMYAHRIEPGASDIALGTDGKDTKDNDVTVVILRSPDSLAARCLERGVPVGVRGPEMWHNGAPPWTLDDPAPFCEQAGLLRYRWETGLTRPSTIALPKPVWSEVGGCRVWTRPQDGRPIPARLRYWNRCAGLSRADLEAANQAAEAELAALLAAVTDRNGDNGTNTDEDNNDPSSTGLSPDDKPEDDDGPRVHTETPRELTCEWLDVADLRRPVLLLDGWLEVMFVSRQPAPGDGAVSVRTRTASSTNRAMLDNDGTVWTTYGSGHSASLACKVTTVLSLGCGATPVLTLTSFSTIEAVMFQGVRGGEDGLTLGVVRSLATARLGCPDLRLGRTPRIVLVTGAPATVAALAVSRAATALVRDGLVRVKSMLLGDRDALYGLIEVGEAPVVSVSAHGNSYVSSPIGLRHVASRDHLFPKRFGARHGDRLFAALTDLWPLLAVRDDVRPPSGSHDPRWIGLGLCLAEWTGHGTMADNLMPGVLEWQSLGRNHHDR